jgi:hypothetical protein
MLQQIILAFALAYGLAHIENKSNYSIYFLPVIVSVLTTKYVLGDTDEGYQYTREDIVYWIVLTIVAIIGVRLAEHQKN